MMARVIHQMHIVHAGRASRHAGQTGQAAVDMLDVKLGCRPVLFQHVLYQVDAPAWTVEFVAEQHVCGARRRAEPAMYAGAQNLLRSPGFRIGKLLG